MKKLELSDNKALEIYRTSADAGLKAILEETWGKKFFAQKITDRVKTFEDACEILGISNPSSLFNSMDTKDEIAYKKLKVIAKALNEGWTPDYTNSSEAKYYPWLTDFRPGFGFSLSAYVDTYSATSVGSRLCFKSSKLALYAGEQFQSIYNEYFL